MNITPKKKTRTNTKNPTLAASLSEAPVRVSFATSGESRTSVPVSKTLDDLQPELLEIIFANLCDDDDNDDSYSKALMKCRAVNQRWKSIVEGMMVRACRPSYLSIQPTYQLEKHLQYPIIPSIVTLTHNQNNNVNFARGACPKFIVSQGRRSPSNPFPSRSLCIMANSQYHFSDWIATATYQGYPTSGFMSNFGHQLTYLTISRPSCCLWWTPRICVIDLIHILRRTPNLNGFVMENIEVLQSKPASRRRQGLPPLPDLTSLKIRHCEEVDPDDQELFDGIPFSSWLLKAYSKQLTCLEVENEIYNALTFETYPKLRELQFGKLNLMSMLPSDKLPLRRLIIKDVVNLQDTPNPFMKLATFFHNFENTLEHLELPYLTDFEDLENDMNLASMGSKKALSRNGPVLFSKLKVLGFSGRNDANKWELLKDYVFLKFKELETLEVVGSGLVFPIAYASETNLIVWMQKVHVADRCWEAHHKLKRIRCFPDIFGSKHLWERL
ncbi:unnamed protein product [Orchesella dallaii]|uniref:F-box domain-containing protein n=1 Tax=Orchesella dallaii TaxID=48710 RepID=A0ABP1RPS8_9HEXA